MIGFGARPLQHEQSKAAYSCALKRSAAPPPGRGWRVGAGPVQHRHEIVADDFTPQLARLRNEGR